MNFTKIIGLSVVLSSFILVTGCNTVKGAGEDIRSVGNAVTPAQPAHAKKHMKAKKVYHKKTTTKKTDTSGATTTTTNTSDTTTTTPDNQ